MPLPPYAEMTQQQKALANERKKRWKLKNRARVAEYKRKHYMENRDKYLTLERDRAYRKRYGITLADYERMAKEQGNRCLICGSDKPGSPRFGFFSVDHCHKTGKVRGLLCVRCNSSLGWFEAHGANILAYVEKHK